jgi:hypothetical protein
MHKGRHSSNRQGTRKKSEKCENALSSSECNLLDGHAKEELRGILGWMETEYDLRSGSDDDDESDGSGDNYYGISGRGVLGESA